VKGLASPSARDASPPAATATRPAAIEPLAPARYKIQLTASAALHAKLERLQALMRASAPEVDLATVIEQAVTEKLDRLEARRFGRSRAPRKEPRGNGHVGHVPLRTGSGPAHGLRTRRWPVLLPG
jgi:hypothetical protein